MGFQPAVDYVVIVGWAGTLLPRPLPTSPATLLVLFGATGDLANRMLLPSLCALDAGQLLPADLRILCTSRSDMDDAGYRAAMRERLAAAERETGADSLALQRFLGRLHYQPASVDDDASMSLLCERIAALRCAMATSSTTSAPRRVSMSRSAMRWATTALPAPARG